MEFRRAYIWRGLVILGGGPITRLKKCFKTNGTTVLINFKVYWPFYASKRHRKLNSFQYKLEGAILGGWVYNGMYFLFTGTVDGPITGGIIGDKFTVLAVIFCLDLEL